MTRHIKLFWIDDMENWAKSAQENLKIIATKYEIELHIISAKNGEDVVQQLMMFDFNAVVMDYHMDPSNGDEYVKNIREHEHLDNVPIFFYSMDNTTDIASLVEDIRNVIPVYRPNLEDKLKELFF